MDTMHHDALTKELQAGFHAAEKPSPAAKNGFVSHISGAAVQHGDKWGGFQDDYESPVNGIASTVAHDMSLLRPDVPTDFDARCALPGMRMG
jgi:hypothetical protein